MDKHSLRFALYIARYFKKYIDEHYSKKDVRVFWDFGSGFWVGGWAGGMLFSWKHRL